VKIFEKGYGIGINNGFLDMRLLGDLAYELQMPILNNKMVASAWVIV
jgi:hypothetical protein